MNRLIVKPMPHSRPSPIIARTSIPSGNRAQPSARIVIAAATIPTGLPSTRPSMIPIGNAANTASRLSPPTESPALANANTGRIA